MRKAESRTPSFAKASSSAKATADKTAGKQRSALIYGLVLAGGRSSRMRMEKSTLRYHGIPQVQYCFQLLAPACSRVFVSLREDQRDRPDFRPYPQIRDRFKGDGPLIGILSAMKAHPEVAWLVLACDLPWVEMATIAMLIEHRVISKTATAFRNQVDGLPEPLCAIYEPSSHDILMEVFQDGRRSPRQALIESQTKLIAAKNPQWLRNANSPEEYQLAAGQLNRETNP